MKPNLKEIATWLNRDEFAGRAFRLKNLVNFRPAAARNLSNYNYSVGAHAFYALCVWDLLLKKYIRLDGKPIMIQIESGFRDPAKQIADYADWQKKCDADPTLRRSQFVNPAVKPSPHSVGIAIDDVIADRPHLKDLMKTDMNPNANNWRPNDEQLVMKDTYFVKFNGADWHNHIFDYEMSAQPEDKPYAERVAQAEGEVEKISKNMHVNAHAVLTAAGAANPDAHVAIANNNALIQMHCCLPFFTPSNDEVYHGQVRRFVDDVEVRKNLMTAADFEKQDTIETAELGNQIMEMAELTWTKPIYYQTTIVPGRRVDFWTEKSRGVSTPTGGSDYLLWQLNMIEQTRDRALGG